MVLLRSALSVAALSLATAFQPAALGTAQCSAHRAAAAPQMSAGDVTRRAALGGLASAVLGVAPAFAGAPDPYKLKKDYPVDAKTLLENMRIATELQRGAPNMETIVKSTRGEMTDFVAFYRRQPKVSGMPSFSTLYTAINTLSGHYASYGNKYPVPEKRRTRLAQQYKEIERALARGK